MRGLPRPARASTGRGDLGSQREPGLPQILRSLAGCLPGGWPGRGPAAGCSVCMTWGQVPVGAPGLLPWEGFSPWLPPLSWLPLPSFSLPLTLWLGSPRSWL